MCYYKFYATETYIMHFLEAPGFLNAPVVAGRKVNYTLCPGFSTETPTHFTPGPYSVWALKQPLCSHLHKITNEPIFYGTCPL